ncbi:hypothetical protein CVT24_011314 [Panaeolus cyanescens]|uniref:Uncharacterized protein n=1 Tax=Panaeolus cyanescens TaxID=181874 RepID=A0A409VL83_9AGAR|nr:hypothetical protein CVT24_011314 [Panaeolus cyanescens]
MSVSQKTSSVDSTTNYSSKVIESNEKQDTTTPISTVDAVDTTASRDHSRNNGEYSTSHYIRSQIWAELCGQDSGEQLAQERLNQFIKTHEKSKEPKEDDSEGEDDDDDVPPPLIRNEAEA